MTKIALLIGISDYGPGFNSLPVPPKNVAALHQVLQHPQVGSFAEVRVLLNPDRQAMEEAIETLFSERQSDDLVLLYFSGRSIQDERGKLYFSTHITRKNLQDQLVKSSVVTAAFVQEMMNESRCQHQFVILDCCWNDALTTDWSDTPIATVDVLSQLAGERRVILTSATSTPNCFPDSYSDMSIYTRYLVEGLQTGAADLDRDGAILISELHEYTRRKVQTAIPAIQPGIYGLDNAQQIILAKAVIEHPQCRYRQAAEQYAESGDFSIVSRSILAVLRDNLGLLPEEAAAIEAAVLQPDREYQTKLQRYVQELVEAMRQETELSDETRQRCRHLQRLLGLTEQNVAAITAQITGHITALRPNDKLLNTTAATSLRSATESTATEPSTQIISDHKISNLDSANSTHANLVAGKRKFQMLIGGGIAATVLALTGAIFGLHPSPDSQQLKTIKALVQERNYEECITVAKTVSKSSSGYTDAQLLLKQCEAGVKWQNVQVQNLPGHSDMIWSVAYSPDGQTLASGSSDNAIKIWKLSSGELLRTLSGHSNTVWSIGYSPNGQTLASGSSDNTIKIWKLSSGELLRTLSGHSDAVRSIAYSPDGQTLASASSDNTIKIWMSSGELLRTLSGHSGTVRFIAYSPDGQTLASASSDNTIKIWKLSSGELLRTLTGHSDRVISVTYSPDGQILASGSVDKTIKIWNPNSGELLRTLSGNLYWVNAVAINSTGRILASGIGDSITVWDLNTIEQLHTISNYSSNITSISFSPNGKGLAVGSQDKTIRIWWR